MSGENLMPIGPKYLRLTSRKTSHDVMSRDKCSTRKYVFMRDNKYLVMNI